MMIEPDHAEIGVSRQCALLGLARSSLYYRPSPADEYNDRLMSLIDEQYTRTPFYGVRRMCAQLRRQGHAVNPKRISRLMRAMGIAAIYPKPRLSAPDNGHRKYLYLLGGLPILRADQVWATDITYIRMRRGFIYLVAIMDWFSRYTLAWEVSTSLDSEFCLRCFEQALGDARPEIFNSDQGSQFTSADFTGALNKAGVAISMDGRGRFWDNIFVERLWRSVKYEEVYLHDYDDVRHACRRLDQYFEFYNHERPHQALGYETPAEVYFRGREMERSGDGHNLVSLGRGLAPSPDCGPSLASRS